ncbi:MAG: hypothetical protein QXI16_06265 [Sulfolobaceae archaeon]
MDYIVDITTAIGDGVTGILGSFGNGIVDFFNSILLTADGELTAFAGWTFALLGIGLGITLVFGILRKLG